MLNTIDLGREMLNISLLGGGIVFDSDPYDEYIETMNKLRASMTSLQKAEERYLKEQLSGGKPVLTPHPGKTGEQDEDEYFAC